MRLVRPHRRPQSNEIPEAAHGSFPALRPRRRPGNGGVGFAALRRGHAAGFRRANPGGRRGRLSAQAKSSETYHDAGRVFARDGRGRAGQRYRGDFRGAGLRARTRRPPARDDVFRPESATPVRLANPLAEDASVLRSTGTVSMATALEWNLNHGQRNIRLFEMGRTYRFHAGAPVETCVLTLGATGEAREKSIHEAAREYSFADMKGDLDALGREIGRAHV